MNIGDAVRKIIRKMGVPALALAGAVGLYGVCSAASSGAENQPADYIVVRGTVISDEYIDAPDYYYESEYDWHDIIRIRDLYDKYKCKIITDDGTIVVFLHYNLIDSALDPNYPLLTPPEKIAEAEQLDDLIDPGSTIAVGIHLKEVRHNTLNGYDTTEYPVVVAPNYYRFSLRDFVEPPKLAK